MIFLRIKVIMYKDLLHVKDNDFCKERRNCLVKIIF